MASFEVHEEATAAAAWRVTWLPVDVPRQTSRPHLNRVLSRRLIELDGVQAAADAPVMVIAASARADCIGPDDVPRQTSRSVRTDSGTQSAQNRVTFIIPAPPSRNCYGKLCSPLDEPPDPRDVGDKVGRGLRMIEAFGRHFQEVWRACGRHERDGDRHDFGRQALASYDTSECYVAPMVLGDEVRVVHDGYFRLSVRVEAL
jgi:hypothetical protein